MLNVLKFSKTDWLLFEKAMALRTEVFVEGLGIDPLLEADEFDEIATHYLAFDNHHPVATARWRETEKGIKLERFAVPESFRNKGTGTFLLKSVLADVLPLKKPIYLHAQHTAVNLYRKNGFKIAGNPFEEAGIIHFYMEFEP